MVRPLLSSARLTGLIDEQCLLQAYSWGDVMYVCSVCMQPVDWFCLCLSDVQILPSCYLFVVMQLVSTF